MSRTIEIDQADLLLVAGDVYDGADRSLRAQLRFRSGLARLHEAGILTYVVHGNHHPLSGWADSLAMPTGVHVFGPEIESVVLSKDGSDLARIHGISYPTRTIGKSFGAGFRREGSEPFQIGLLHCNCGGDRRHDPYAPRTPEQMASAGLDYWALGHIHASVVLRDRDPFTGYPGNTQGRHANEAGPRGCFHVRVDGDGRLAVGPEFVATDVVRWLPSRVRIEGADTMDGLLEQTESTLDALTDQAEGRPVVTRMAISGRGPLHQALNRPDAIRSVLDEVQQAGLGRTPCIWVQSLAVGPGRKWIWRRDGRPRTSWASATRAFVGALSALR